MSLARKVATVGTATLLSRLLGFVRDVAIAAVLGAGVFSDAFLAALQIPNLFRRLLAEGALNSAFVPMWLRIRHDAGADAARRFGADVLSTMLVALATIALAGVIFAPAVVRIIAPGFEIGGERFAHAVNNVRLSIPYIAIAGIVAVAASVLNAEGRVAAAAWGVVVFNGVMIAAVVAVIAFGSAPSAGTVLSLAVVLAGVAQLAAVGAGAVGLLARPQLRLAFSPLARRFFALAIPGVVAAGVPQLKLMAGAIVASPSPAAVSWLYYANRLYELPLGVVSIAIASALAPAIAAGLRSGESMRLAAAQSRAIEITLGLALPSAAAFALLASPLARGLFERGAFGASDTAAVAAALTAMAAGLPGHALEKMLGAVSFAHEDTRTPMLAALAGLATALAGALALFPRYGHVGVAAAIAISGWIGATLLSIVLARRNWLRLDATAWRRLPRIGLATAAMALVIAALQIALALALGSSASSLVHIGQLLVLVTGGLAVYLAALQGLDVARLRDLAAAIRYKPHPTGDAQ